MKTPAAKVAELFANTDGREFAAVQEPIGDPIPADKPDVSTGPSHGASMSAPFYTIADGQFRRLDPRFIRVEQIENWIFDAVVGLLLLIGLVVQWWFDWFPAWIQFLLVVIAICVMAGSVWLTLCLPTWSYEASSYAVSDLGIEIRQGIWWKRVIDVPRSRLQHIDVAQGPLARRYGIAKLILYTAGTQHASVELDGLAHNTALGIRDFLLRGGGSDGV